MKKATQAKRFRDLLGRGALGGAIAGMVVSVVLLNPITVGNSWLFWLPISYVFFDLPSGLFIGTIIATAIWFIHRRTAAQLGPLMRAAIGALIAMVCWGLFFKLKNQSEYATASWQWYLAAVFLFGTITGVITGLVVGAPTYEIRHSERNEQQGAIIESESKM